MGRKAAVMEQCGFGFEEEAIAQEQAAKTAHFPARDDWDGAVEYFRRLLVAQNQAVLDGNVDERKRLDEDADLLVDYLHGGRLGCCDTQDKLSQATKSPDGEVPMWGQEGTFEVYCKASRGLGCKVRVKWDGMFGICGLSANIVDKTHRFLSDSGYRSFCGGVPHAFGTNELPAGMTPDKYCVAIFENYIEDKKYGLGGKLVEYEESSLKQARLNREYRERRDAEEARKAKGEPEPVVEDDQEMDEDPEGTCDDCGMPYEECECGIEDDDETE